MRVLYKIYMNRYSLCSNNTDAWDDEFLLRGEFEKIYVLWKRNRGCDEDI